MITVGALSFSDEEELEAYFDEQLFEIKKEILQKPLLRATMKSRLKKLEQLKEIESILELEEANPAFFETTSNAVFSQLSVQEQWKQFASMSSKWKLSLSSASSIESLKTIIENGFEIWKNYCSTIPEFDLIDEDPKVGIAENVMILQEGFRWMQQNEVSSIKELFEKHGENEVLKMFFIELKRLSLRVPYL